MPERKYVDKYDDRVTSTTGSMIECPYCGDEIRIDDFPGEDQVLEYDCGECAGKFGLTVAITHRYIAMPEESFRPLKPEEIPQSVTDLMEALRQSVEAAKAKRMASG